MSLQVRLLTDCADLLAHGAAWDRLADSIPFRTSSWISAWWRHYGASTAGPSTPLRAGRKQNAQLFVPTVFDGSGRLLAIAPWCRRFSLTEGWVLEWLGGGETCSDYLGLVSDNASVDDVADALASWLCDSHRSPDERWDLIRLDAVDAQDQPTAKLVEALKRHRCPVHRRDGPRCWRLDLPPRWEDYLERLSKSHRKQVRRLERNLLGSGRARLHTVQNPDELPRAFAMLIDLHERRRAFLGQRGRFSSPRFTAFHRDVSARLAERGQCAVHWLEIDGQPAAAEYEFRGDGINFAYQSGIDPERLELEPGNLITVALLKQAIERGDRGIDFLRGDEPYKSHFRAEPRPTVRFRHRPCGAADRESPLPGLFGWTAAFNIKNWLVQPWDQTMSQ